MDYLVLGFAPGLFWLWFFYKKDKFEPEPKRLILKVFLFGIFISIPILIVENLAASFLWPLQTISFSLYYLFFNFLVVGPTEEFFKYFVVKKTVYKKEEFNEVMDGIIYCIASALGFASIENVGYMLQFGKTIIIFRSMTATLTHAICSGILGYYLGLAKFNKEKEAFLITKGLLIASIIHGLYNFVLCTRTLRLAVILILAGSLFFLFKKIKQAQTLSPFKDDQTIH
ncbi:MAG: PrsW family intramembrane metalloprotease [Spirochaetes bacterium]|nr:PrsW family intramembrane metalloprotease [Spirochaetota bacterium]